jgi:hypothetical protein
LECFCVYSLYCRTPGERVLRKDKQLNTWVRGERKEFHKAEGFWVGEVQLVGERVKNLQEGLRVKLIGRGPA